ncbi:voltage-dependent calcium channel subunit alpha-2/delta-3-like [Cydia splendana]|uniref:voltage-dependent calcium channel subunit alpha-2/delta-3-like n=1 Tax=Cydia splendana TaxID=1100963 RepID=UPI00212459C4
MRGLSLAFCALLMILREATPARRSERSNTVKAWADRLGEEIWELNEALTKAQQIKAEYQKMNASVRRKDGMSILESSLTSVRMMLTKKINAVKCIHATAIELAKKFKEEYNGTADDEFEYCSAKYSVFMELNEFGNDTVVIPTKEDPEKIPKFTIAMKHFYENVTVDRDSHFYNIRVNTDKSCVHVPTNIFFREEEPRKAILWTKDLNDIFTKNYNADPSLTWQYFGSSHGVLRFFPAMRWNQMDTDIYDCRVQSWYIEAATCSKDMIILFDVSGSMTGFKNYVARTTLKSLLDTLSNNDYVNVYYFKNVTGQVMNCSQVNSNSSQEFSVVQATKENIGTILEILTPTEDGKKHKIELDGYANLTEAYIKAFTTLRARREETNCNVASIGGCNQMIMLITDYVSGNFSDIFEQYNREVVNGKTYTPVRVFTYLIGKEVSNVDEIKSMACNNRGTFDHIHSVEEVQQQVLKYINVIAKPMILNGTKPPPTWTHASMDKTRTKDWDVSPDVSSPDEDKLVTSVAIPAFIEGDVNATLLGVAGTDVPIDSIAKLAKPHQLGVNGYSFIVSNNGYLLLHPLLITSINGELQVNYNSVDFVEVEQVDDGKDARELGDKIQWLRQNLTEAKRGNMTEVEVLFHYDDMRRIARVKHDYFFNELEGTPFSMGISLPEGYGDTELILKDNPLEATQGQDLIGINVTQFFNYSYRIHPDWVYCKYHYLEGHESETPEIEIWKFLVRISKNDLNISKTQYKIESQAFSVDSHCGDKREILDKDDYYCNEDLVKQLVFDAKLSAPYFKDWEDHSEREAWLADKYNVSVRFIMTSSGLTRWHYLNDDDKNEVVNEQGERSKIYDGNIFGDDYRTGIETTPYKAAVLQRNQTKLYNRESLVVATRLPILDQSIKDRPSVKNDDGDITITASYAIFYKDKGIDTPASVVGFQFSYKHFWQSFSEITKSVGGKSLSCDGIDHDCYVIDSSGYVVLSNNSDEVGQFFGEIHPLVLQSFIDKQIFEHVEVFNYQALCPNSILPKPSSSWGLITPFTLLKWILTEFLILLGDFYNWNQYVYGMPEDFAQSTTPLPETVNNETVQAVDEDEETFSCDHRIRLYIMNQTHFLKTAEDHPVTYEETRGECHPPYWASYVRYTNLMIVVVEKMGLFEFNVNCEKPPTTKPVPTNNSIYSREPCHKLELGKLPRRRLEGCFTFHEKEANASTCSLAALDLAAPRIVAVATLLAALVPMMLC